MASGSTCPHCSAPIPEPAPDRPATCPGCGMSVHVGPAAEVQAGLPPARPAPAAGSVKAGLPPLPPTERRGGGADDLDIRVPARPPELRQHTNVTAGLVALVVAGEVGIVASELYRLGLVQQFIAGAGRADLPDRLQGADSLCALVFLGRGILFLASTIVFLTWIYRAYSNLAELRATGVPHSPGSAVGNFFIPFLNLVRGYTVLQALWRASSPELTSGGEDWQRGPGTGLIRLWWLLYLAANVLRYIASAMMESASHGGLEQFRNGEFMNIIAAGAFIVDGLLLILILRGVTRRQEERYLALGVRRPGEEEW